MAPDIVASENTLSTDELILRLRSSAILSTQTATSHTPRGTPPSSPLCPSPGSHHDQSLMSPANRDVEVLVLTAMTSAEQETACLMVIDEIFKRLQKLSTAVLRRRKERRYSVVGDIAKWNVTARHDVTATISHQEQENSRHDQEDLEHSNYMMRLIEMFFDMTKVVTTTTTKNGSFTKTPRKSSSDTSTITRGPTSGQMPDRSSSSTSAAVTTTTVSFCRWNSVLIRFLTRLTTVYCEHYYDRVDDETNTDDDDDDQGVGGLGEFDDRSTAAVDGVQWHQAFKEFLGSIVSTHEQLLLLHLRGRTRHNLGVPSSVHEDTSTPTRPATASVVSSPASVSNRGHAPSQSSQSTPTNLTGLLLALHDPVNTLKQCTPPCLLPYAPLLHDVTTLESLYSAHGGAVVSTARACLEEISECEEWLGMFSRASSSVTATPALEHTSYSHQVRKNNVDVTETFVWARMHSTSTGGKQCGTNATSGTRILLQQSRISDNFNKLPSTGGNASSPLGEKDIVVKSAYSHQGQMMTHLATNHQHLLLGGHDQDTSAIIQYQIADLSYESSAPLPALLSNKNRKHQQQIILAPSVSLPTPTDTAVVYAYRLSSAIGTACRQQISVLLSHCVSVLCTDDDNASNSSFNNNLLSNFKRLTTPPIELRQLHTVLSSLTAGAATGRRQQGADTGTSTQNSSIPWWYFPAMRQTLAFAIAFTLDSIGSCSRHVCTTAMCSSSSSSAQHSVQNTSRGKNGKRDRLKFMRESVFITHFLEEIAKGWLGFVCALLAPSVLSCGADFTSYVIDLLLEKEREYCSLNKETSRTVSSIFLSRLMKHLILDVPTNGLGYQSSFDRFGRQSVPTQSQNASFAAFVPLLRFSIAMWNQEVIAGRPSGSNPEEDDGEYGIERCMEKISGRVGSGSPHSSYSRRKRWGTINAGGSTSTSDEDLHFIVEILRNRILDPVSVSSASAITSSSATGAGAGGSDGVGSGSAMMLDNTWASGYGLLLCAQALLRSNRNVVSGCSYSAGTSPKTAAGNIVREGNALCETLLDAIMLYFSSPSLHAHCALVKSCLTHAALAADEDSLDREGSGDSKQEEQNEASSMDDTSPHVNRGIHINLAGNNVTGSSLLSGVSALQPQDPRMELTQKHQHEKHHDSAGSSLLGPLMVGAERIYNPAAQKNTTESNVKWIDQFITGSSEVRKGISIPVLPTAELSVKLCPTVLDVNAFLGRKRDHDTKCTDAQSSLDEETSKKRHLVIPRRLAARSKPSPSTMSMTVNDSHDELDSVKLRFDVQIRSGGGNGVSSNATTASSIVGGKLLAFAWSASAMDEIKSVAVAECCDRITTMVAAKHGEENYHQQFGADGGSSGRDNSNHRGAARIRGSTSVLQPHSSSSSAATVVGRKRGAAASMILPPRGSSNTTASARYFKKSSSGNSNSGVLLGVMNSVRTHVKFMSSLSDSLWTPLAESLMEEHGAASGLSRRQVNSIMKDCLKEAICDQVTVDYCTSSFSSGSGDDELSNGDAHLIGSLPLSLLQQLKQAEPTHAGGARNDDGRHNDCVTHPSQMPLHFDMKLQLQSMSSTTKNSGGIHDKGHEAEQVETEGQCVNLDTKHNSCVSCGMNDRHGDQIDKQAEHIIHPAFYMTSVSSPCVGATQPDMERHDESKVHPPKECCPRPVDPPYVIVLYEPPESFVAGASALGNQVQVFGPFPVNFTDYVSALDLVLPQHEQVVPTAEKEVVIDGELGIENYSLCESCWCEKMLSSMDGRCHQSETSCGDEGSEFFSACSSWFSTEVYLDEPMVASCTPKRMEELDDNCRAKQDGVNKKDSISLVKEIEGMISLLRSPWCRLFRGPQGTPILVSAELSLTDQDEDISGTDSADDEVSNGPGDGVVGIKITLKSPYYQYIQQMSELILDAHKFSQS